MKRRKRIVRSVYVGAEDWQWLQQYCNDRDITVSAAIELMITERRRKEDKKIVKTGS